MVEQGKSFCATLKAGNYIFTHAEARQCALLHQHKSTIWQIKEQHHPNAILKEIIVAIQVGIMWETHLERLNPHIYDPNLVCLQVWDVGQPTQNNE